MPANPDLWVEYIKLEVGWVEALRRRWKVLGILDEVLVKTENNDDDGVDVEGAEGFTLDPLKEEDDETDPIDQGRDQGKGAFGQTGESARKKLVDGQLVLTVLRNSFARPGLRESLDYRLRLVHLFRKYPTGLRTKLLGCVYESMRDDPLDRDHTARRVRSEAKLFDRTYDPEVDEQQMQDGQAVSHPVRGESDRIVLARGEEKVRTISEIIKTMKAVQDVEAVLDDGKRGQEARIAWRREWEEEVGEWILRWAGRMSDDEEDLVSRPRKRLFCLSKPK